MLNHRDVQKNTPADQSHSLPRSLGPESWRRQLAIRDGPAAACRRQAGRTGDRRMGKRPRLCRRYMPLGER